MNMKCFTIVGLLLVFAANLQAQTAQQRAAKYLFDTAENYDLSMEDLADWIVTDEHVSRQSGVHHIYVRQRYQGIEIFGANASVHVLANGNLLTMNNRFLSEIETRLVSETIPTLSATEALTAAAAQLNYNLTQPPFIEDDKNTRDNAVVISKGNISEYPIPAKLTYYPDEEGNLHLAWDMSIAELDGQNWWSIRVDATTGQILDQINWVVRCDFAINEHCENDSHLNCSNKEDAKVYSKGATSTVMTSSYNVFAEPVESPIHGARTIEVDPEDLTASPYGWHDTDGMTGAEHTITRGNNVWAQEDHNNNNGTGYSPDGGSTLVFDFPINFSQHPNNYLDAAITNLFYWNNLIHDVIYQYGFDEVSGNFQQNNYSRGGFGNDFVFADAQDGSGTNNANFGTPPDGSNPRMQMYIWTAANPDRDSDLDNGVIVHEYGHGISNRLTGGAANSGCLGNREQMGEGWSDWYALMFTMKASDTSTTNRPIGTYVKNQPVSGPGIRVHPYTTDMTENPDTYNTIKSTSSVHRTGSVWCAMIWEVTWALVDKYGFDPDLYYGTGGNNIALQLVTEGLKLQPCSPGFVDGRDAILAADTALYNGANSCEIWNAFAKRGLGYSATQGNTNSRTDGSEAFDLPPGVPSNCSTTPNFLISLSPVQKHLCADTMLEFTVSILSSNGFNSPVTLSATTLPTGATAMFNPTIVNSIPGTSILTLTTPIGIAPGNYTLGVTGTSGAINQIGAANIVVVDSSPPSPTLQSPSNGSSVPSRIQNLIWDPVTHSIYFDVQIATDINFTSIVESATQIEANDYTTSQILSANTTYYWRVRTTTICGTGSYSVPSSFMIEACGNSFVDSGGTNGEYDDGELFVYTICPDTIGDFIKMDFSVFDIEPRLPSSCWDHMDAYNGIDKNAPYLGRYCGDSVADAPGGGTIYGVNPTGCLTFEFFSDGYVTEAGWEATITCVDCITPIIDNVQSTAASCLWSNDGSLTVTATTAGNPEFVLTPSVGDPILSTSGVFNYLEAGTYTLLVRERDNPSCISASQNVNINAVNNTGNTIVYVNALAMGSNDGTSWTDAYTDLQIALGSAGHCDQIWVAAGTYLPSVENPYTTATGMRDQSFSINQFIGIYGGFAGTENMVDQADPVANLTTLSGDLGTIGDESDNTWHVFWIEESSCIIDGFTITDGNADGVLPDNQGGGLFVNGVAASSKPIFNECFFRNNKATNGAAVYNDGSGSTSECSPSFINTRFSGNIAAGEGGAMYNDGGSGGQSAPMIINSSFFANTANQGGGFYNNSSKPEIYNTILWNNTSPGDNSMHNNASNPVIEFSLLEEANCPMGATCDATTMNLLGRDPLFKDADGIDNISGTADDDLSLQAASPAIDEGMVNNAPLQGVDQTERPQGHGFDIGAFESPAVQLNLKVLLEGPYQSLISEMSTELEEADVLPTIEPYTSLGFTHLNGGGGETTTTSILEANAITDWIFVELRDKNDSSIIIATRAALLKSNGEIADVDGQSSLVFFDKPSDDYFIAVRHRNHLGILSANTHSLSNVSTSLDLSNSLSIVEGGALSLVDLGGGSYGMPAGDFNANGQIQNTDYNAVLPLLGLPGYSSADFNLNAQIQNSDLQLYLLPNLGRGIQYNY